MGDCNAISSLEQITTQQTRNMLLSSSSPELILMRTPSFSLTSATSLMTKVTVKELKEVAMRDNRVFVLPILKPQRVGEAPVTRIEENKIEKKAGDESRKAQND